MGYSGEVAARFGDQLKQLIDACQRVERGDLEHHVRVQEDDEAGQLGRAFNSMMDRLAERDRIRATFATFMSQQVSDAILKGDVRLGGEERELTILRWNMPQSEELSLTMETQPLVALINRYLAVIVEAVMAHDGVIDKYLGAGGMVVYGAPVKTPNHARNAVLSALECKKRLAAFNRAEKKLSGRTLGINIGISSGPAVTGNIGSELRMEYTVLGRTAVVAERLAQLCGQTKRNILVSGQTAAAAGDGFRFSRLKDALDLGIGDAISVYAVGPSGRKN